MRNPFTLRHKVPLSLLVVCVTDKEVWGTGLHRVLR